MKKKMYYIIILMLTVVLFSGGRSFAYRNDNTFINVKLTNPIKNNKVIQLESKTGFAVYDKNNKINPIDTIEQPNIKAVIDKAGDISITDLKGNVFLTLQKDNTYLLSSYGIRDNLIKVENLNYRGYINLQNIKGDIRVLNHIDIEEYLYGLVPKEMPASFPIEALKAQAVAARTYATNITSKHIKEGYNICDTTHCQVYGGYDGEKPTTTSAVEKTRGILALYNGKIIDALYHSCSGGHTNSAVDVWGGNYPYLIGVKDDYSVGSPHSQWSVSIDKKVLESKLAANSINIGSLQSIELSKVSTSGNVENIILKGSKSSKEIKGSTFRSIIGSTQLKSTKFTIQNGIVNKPVVKQKEVYVIDGSGKIVLLDTKQANVIGKDGKEKKISSSNKVRTANSIEDLEIVSQEQTDNSTPSNVGDTIVLQGRGFGHGVGMSQYGAKNMAELGHNYKEILKFYYRGIDVQ